MYSLIWFANLANLLSVYCLFILPGLGELSCIDFCPIVCLCAVSIACDDGVHPCFFKLMIYNQFMGIWLFLLKVLKTPMK